MNAVDNYIRRRDYKKRRIRERFPILIAIAEIMLKDVVDAINNCVCPYCSARMRTRFATIHHILVCHIGAYYDDIKRVVDVYAKLRKRLTKTSRCANGICTQVFRLRVGDINILGKQRDIAKEILRNPSILQKLGVM
jgi:hypothetical protein